MPDVPRPGAAGGDGGSPGHVRDAGGRDGRRGRVWRRCATIDVLQLVVAATMSRRPPRLSQDASARPTNAAAVFTLAAPWWQVPLRTAIVYAALLIGLRLTGKREMGQMTVFDLVVLLVLSNAVQNAMVGQDTSVLGGLIAAATLLIINRLVAQARLRSERLRRVIEGSPTVLVHNGGFDDAAMRREGVDRAEVETALREHGISNVEAVQFAVLEPDGSISVVPVDSHVVRLRKHRKFFNRP